MIYEVCGICAALTTDIETHTAWHDTFNQEVPDAHE